MGERRKDSGEGEVKKRSVRRAGRGERREVKWVRTQERRNGW